MKEFNCKCGERIRLSDAFTAQIIVCPACGAEIMPAVCEKLSDYLRFLDKKIKDAEETLRSDPEWLARMFEDAERSEAFKVLESVCSSTIEVPEYRWIGRTQYESVWTGILKRFFRMDGIYLRIADGDSPAPEKILERLVCEINRKECTVTYLALIDNIEQTITYRTFIDNNEETAEEISFGEFSLEYLDADALKDVLNFRNRSVFYPHTLTGFSRFQDHYFLVVVREKRHAGFGGFQVIAKGVGSSTISRRLTQLPLPVEKGLRTLVLYDWKQIWQEQDEKSAIEKRVGWRGFGVPAIITVTDDLLGWPVWLPSAEKIEMEDDMDDEDNANGEKPAWPIFSLDEKESKKLTETLVELHDALSSLESNKEAEFLRNAAGFLLKGFLSERLEQLLWHMIAIEAALGEQLSNESVTRVMQRRLGLILGETEASRKEVGKAFYNLYSIRSGLVHGDHLRKDVFEGHLAEARKLARAAVVWAIRGFSLLAKKGNVTPTLAPKRSDLLRLLDMTEEERLRLPAQVSWLPSSFPRVPDWTE